MKGCDKVTIIGASIITALLIACLAVTVYASPFIVCDPQAGVTSYQMTGWTAPTQPAEVNGSVKLDIATATVGAHSMTFKACKNDAVWGVLCSEAVPFTFTRPPAPVIPAGIGLIP
jgi:hypothetical protein